MENKLNELIGILQEYIAAIDNRHSILGYDYTLELIGKLERLYVSTDISKPLQSVSPTTNEKENPEWVELYYRGKPVPVCEDTVNMFLDLIGPLEPEGSNYYASARNGLRRKQYEKARELGFDIRPQDEKAK